MNKILCDNQECEKEIILTKNSIESKFLRGGIQINFFRCRSCNTKYLIDVTDKETRSKQIEYANLLNYQKDLMNMIKISHNAELDLKTVENNQAMENLLKEIKATKAELKAKYEGEL
jgi:hypothetical protein